MKGISAIFDHYNNIVCRTDQKFYEIYIVGSVLNVQAQSSFSGTEQKLQQSF